MVVARRDLDVPMGTLQVGQLSLLHSWHTRWPLGQTGSGPARGISIQTGHSILSFNLSTMFSFLFKLSIVTPASHFKFTTSSLKASIVSLLSLITVFKAFNSSSYLSFSPNPTFSPFIFFFGGIFTVSCRSESSKYKL